MNRDEQVGLHAARLLHPRVERNEVVVVAREHRAHARLGVDERLESARDRERHVLLAGAAPADRTRVLAAVPGIDGDDDRTARCGLRPGRRAARLCRRRRASPRLALEQRHQRIGRRQRIEVEHDAVAIFADRLQREESAGSTSVLRSSTMRSTPGLKRRDANRLDIRIVRTAPDAAAARARWSSSTSSQIEHQTRRILDRQHLMRHGRAGFENQPRVFLRRPEARGGDRRRTQRRRAAAIAAPAAAATGRRDAAASETAIYGADERHAARHALPCRRTRREPQARDLTPLVRSAQREVDCRQAGGERVRAIRSRTRRPAGSTPQSPSCPIRAGQSKR